jgi:hypothetical protein
MLYSVKRQKIVTELPYKKDYDAWKKNLSDEDLSVIETELRKQFEGDINTSSWIPGSDWSNTVYQPIYHACGNNPTTAGMFFGLIVFKLLMETKAYEDDSGKVVNIWGYDKYALNGKNIKGNTYFRLKSPPEGWEEANELLDD